MIETEHTVRCDRCANFVVIKPAVLLKFEVEEHRTLMRAGWTIDIDTQKCLCPVCSGRKTNLARLDREFEMPNNCYECPIPICIVEGWVHQRDKIERPKDCPLKWVVNND